MQTNTQWVKVRRSLSLCLVGFLVAVAILPTVVRASTQSKNWSGYAIGGSPGSVSDAKGSWTVPTVTCGLLEFSGSSFWVGIDGWPQPSTTVEQIGTISDCVAGFPVNYAFYEFYPGGPNMIHSVPISAGDDISAEVSYSNGQFTVTLTDETTGAPFSTTSTVSNAQRSSVEWIAEAPGATLADFGTAGYGYDDTGVANTCDATVGTQTGSIGSFTSATPIALVNNGNVSVPSALSTDGSSFSVKWEGSSLLSDTFTKDKSLNSKLWTANSAFLTSLAYYSSSPPASFIAPQLTFGNQSGMQMTGPTQDFETTGVQSLLSFTPPFTVTTSVTATQGTAVPFEIFLASSNLTQFLTVTANVNPTYDGMWATAPNVSQLWQLGEQFTPPIPPAFNTIYKVVIRVTSTGSASVKVENSAGKVLGSVFGLEPGTGPFYLVLGQRIGNAPTGSQVADWFNVKVNAP